MRSIEAPVVPALDAAMVATMLDRHYGVRGALTPLPSERDQNFRVVEPNGRSWVAKVAHPDEDAAFAMQAALLAHVARVDPSLAMPRVAPALNGDPIVSIAVRDAAYRLRLVSWLDGVPLAEASRSGAQLRQVGDAAGRLSRALRSFGHAGAHRAFAWDLARTLDNRSRLVHVTDATRRARLAKLLDTFERRVAPRLPELRHGVIHGDLNDWNVLVAPDDPSRIAGIIDVGDAVFSAQIGELAIAATYAMLGARSPLAAAQDVVVGFCAQLAVEPAEADLLLDLIRARLVTSLCLAAARRAQSGEGNTYWYVSEAPAWELLAFLDGVNEHHARAMLRHACGLEPASGGQEIQRWIAAKAQTFAPILGAPLARHRLQRLDWGDPTDPVVSATVRGDLAGADAAYAQAATTGAFDVGIGAWGEHRATYAADAFASRLLDGARRSVHLGLDVFVDAGAALYAPIDGVVLATADCQRPQDYGGVLLVEHRTETGVAFRTLWGHLAPSSIAHWRPGDSIPTGAMIARLGASHENGGWVPHLHLQLCCSGETDPESIVGVGEPELGEVWRSLYPDPTLLAGVPPEALTLGPPGDRALLARRERILGRNLSLSYRRPLHIVRGHDVWLVDSRGRHYLDCYNNVAHVGHAHPRVTAAIAEQAAQLNTNTRYLHERILEYAEALTRSLPAPLSVCFLTCSGSEANELALRMVRAHTGRRDVLVLDQAYHGSTTSLVEMSPYKYKQRGGGGRPSHVHEVPVPDPYRAPADWPVADIGVCYARAVERVIEGGVLPGALFAETIPSCAGQIVVPGGFFQQAFAALRRAGGLCVLDEVQVGFGRVGTAMWAFEEHGLVPDIVTMGKPIANGHPMGAVVTTPEVAASFASGPEYFNTFGGNPVSCAAALAVLGVLRDERLPENAKARGEEIEAGLRALAGRYPLIGDVRGRGLFLGAELVTDPRSKAPATDLAAAVVDRCRELGVLLGTDGPAANVIKLRPPMTTKPEHVRLLLDVFAQAVGDAVEGR
ncbi:MAG: aminotransferase class III-fold pyridoxal phosphate-dependent enzyme [Gemmatimonadaceae bacterium]|nr:aminotransferase class III-fold pyridoxal phosphate-dependent enzyme [Gemmatimonadaceae bacterium]